MAIPSITMIPSGYKAEKVYSVLPTNGDGDLFFDRNTPATRVNKDGLIEQVGTDVPTLDYSDGSCPSLLLEPASTNLARYSEDFSQWWQRTNLTVTTNQTTSPSGDLTADKLQRTSTTYNYLRKGISKDSQQLNMTISIFVKQGEGDFFAIRGQGDYPNRIDAIYQFSTNELNTSVGGNNFTVINSSVKEHINGWVRLSISFNTDDYHSFGTFFSPRNTSGFVDHNDSSSSSFVYIWGAQLEEQRYATSYIPTTSETVSRGADSELDSGDLSNYINSTAGVYYTEIKFDYSTERVASTGGLVLGSDNSFPSPQAIEIAMSEAGAFRIGKRDSSFTELVSLPSGVNYKVAVKWDSLNLSVYVNGVEEDTSTISSTNFQYIYHSSGDSSKYIKDLRVYNTALTDAELITLTTI